MEEQAIYSIGEQSFPQTWAVHFKHVSMVKDLVARGIAKSASEAARMLIEAGYEKFNTEPVVQS